MFCFARLFQRSDFVGCFHSLYSKLSAVPLAGEMPIQQLTHEHAEEGVRAVQPGFRYPSVLDIHCKMRGSEEVRGYLEARPDRRARFRREIREKESWPRRKGILPALATQKTGFFQSGISLLFLASAGFFRDELLQFPAVGAQ